MSLSRSLRSRRIVWVIAAFFTPLAIAVAQPKPKGSASATASSSPPASSASSVSSVASSAGPVASTSASGSINSTCVEQIPQGVKRPGLKEAFPLQAKAGYDLVLEVDVEHGRGEQVLAQGFVTQHAGPDAKHFSKAGFALAQPDGGAPARIEAKPVGENDERAHTVVSIHFIALPKEPGPHPLELPPVPITLSRASGELFTVCTVPHSVMIQDPTSNTPDATPKPNPPARRQKEIWVLAQRASETLLVAAIAAIVGAIVYTWWRRRPKPVPPPPPPRPAWEVALEALERLQNSNLLRDGKTVEYVDQVSDIARRYLGDRYGFDGVESTSREIRKALHAIVPPLTILSDVDQLLEEADLIKFAKVIPSQETCKTLFSLAEQIVRSTIPVQTTPTADPSSEPPGDPT